jgi:hypothetical protein
MAKVLCAVCGGPVEHRRCLNCSAFQPKRRWWIFPALVAVLAVALDLAIGSDHGPHHMAAMAGFFDAR